MSNAGVAIEIAYEAHRGQFRKGILGEPYITHPINVADIAMRQIHPLFYTTELNLDYVEQVALLHDVVEDSDVTIEDLQRQGFNIAVLEAVDALTKKDDDYLGYVNNLKKNKLASIVKIADITHNSRTAKGRDKLHKYKMAVQIIAEFHDVPTHGLEVFRKGEK